MIVLACGVRQGGVILPTLFAVNVDDIMTLSRSNHECRIEELIWGASCMLKTFFNIGIYLLLTIHDKQLH